MKLFKTVATSDDTIKYVFELIDGSLIESVLIPQGQKTTFCISTQVGCPISCNFCQSGKNGFNRNLSAKEIVGQVLMMNEISKTRPYSIVFMGSGEPLLNVENVIESVKILNDTSGYNFSQKRITISTSGIIDGIKKLREKTKCKLAISLHATNDSVRDGLIPYNKKYNISELISIAYEFSRNKKDKVMIEYMMIKDLNDSDLDLEWLKRLDSTKIIFNLSSYNVIGDDKGFKPSSKVNYFKEELIKSGFKTLIRLSRGNHSNSACGQLVAKFSKI